MIKLMIFIFLIVAFIAVFGFDFSGISSGFGLFNSALSSIGSPIISFFGSVFGGIFSNSLLASFLFFLLLLVVFDIVIKSFLSRR